MLATTVVLGGVAHAEPTESVRSSALTREPDGPWLHLDDAVLPTNLEGFDAKRDGKSTEIEIGPVRAVLEGSWWVVEDTPDIPEGVRDIPGRGWRAGVRTYRDIGPVRVGAHASINHVDSRYGRGMYSDVGLSISKTFRLSRWMTAWISLGIGQRRWRGEAPDGESNGTQVMLTIGTTFR